MLNIITNRYEKNLFLIRICRKLMEYLTCILNNDLKSTVLFALENIFVVVGTLKKYFD